MDPDPLEDVLDRLHDAGYNSDRLHVWSALDTAMIDAAVGRQVLTRFSETDLEAKINWSLNMVGHLVRSIEALEKLSQVLYDSNRADAQKVADARVTLAEVFKEFSS